MHTCTWGSLVVEHRCTRAHTHVHAYVHVGLTRGGAQVDRESGGMPSPVQSVGPAAAGHLRICVHVYACVCMCMHAWLYARMYALARLVVARGAADDRPSLLPY